MKVTVNDSLAAQLSGIVERTEIRRADGTLLGYFTPSEETVKLYEWARSQFDPAEIARRKRDPRPGNTTKEVLEYLESLEPMIDD